MEVRESSAKYLRTSYVQTDLGVLPADWRIAEIGEIAETSSGTTPSRSQYDRYFKGGVHAWVKTLDLNNAEILETDESVTDKAVEETSLRLFPEGSVLVAMYGGLRQIGRTGLLRLPAAVNQAITAIRPNQAVFRPEFLLFYLNHRVGHWQSVASSSRKDPNITGADVRAFKLPLPEIGEQQRVATALADVNALIDSLEQLLTKKRQIKQGAMQELLTGKRRLPGFNGRWVSCMWGELIDTCSSGATPLRSRPDYYRGSIRWISSGELNYNVINETIEHISSEAFEQTNLKLHPVGTFLMAITGLEAEGTRGACGIVGKPAATNQSCMAIYPTSKLLTAYLFHYYVYRGNDLALRYCQGTKQQSYTAALVRVLPIECPESTDEQLAIAEALGDMDAEITALEDRVTKARALKQAMAQALLTGRIRLLEPTT
ncbi:MAG: restriction endonuclease subunit S [Rubrivivax sp.]